LVDGITVAERLSQLDPAGVRVRPATIVHEGETISALSLEAIGAVDPLDLAMALHYLRSGGSNVPGATRKAVQALGALNRLEMLSVGSGARTTGRA
jgi:hypothetical protein